MKKDYSDVLNKIKVALYILIALFVVNIVLNVIDTNVSSRTYSNLSASGAFGTSNENDNNEEEEPLEYDVSSFKAVTHKEFIEDIKSEDYTVVYVGRSTCGYCAKFLPMMKQGQEEFGFKTLYYDITQVIDFAASTIIDQEAHDEIVAIDDFFSENFGATPMVAVFKDGKYVNGTVGYTDYATYAKFLEDSGLEMEE